MDNVFADLVHKLQNVGFVAYWRKSPSGHPYVIAGTHEIGGNIKLIQNAIMITCDPNWLIQITWIENDGQDFVEENFASVVSKSISFLNSRKCNDK